MSKDITEADIEQLREFLSRDESERGPSHSRDVVRAVLAERDKFREHSIALNSIGWKVAVALGKATPTADQSGKVTADIDELVDELIERAKPEPISDSIYQYGSIPKPYTDPEQIVALLPHQDHSEAPYRRRVDYYPWERRSLPEVSETSKEEL